MGIPINSSVFCLYASARKLLKDIVEHKYCSDMKLRNVNQANISQKTNQAIFRGIEFMDYKQIEFMTEELLKQKEF